MSRDHPDQPTFLDLLGLHSLPDPTTRTSPPAAAVRRRRKPSNAYRYVRKVKGAKWQARVWVGVDALPGGSLNLGLYDSEWEAGRAVKRYIRTGELPPGVLPKWVREAGEFGFVAEVRKSGHRILLGPYPTDLDAHRAMRDHLAQRFPRPSKPPRLTANQRRERRADQGRWVDWLAMT